MNRFYIAIATLCSLTLLISLAGCQANAATTTSAQEPSQHDAVAQVTGLSCPQCANSLKLIMEKDDAIQSATVDLKGGQVYIQFETGKSLTADEIASLVKDAGFTPGKVTLNNKGAK